jgi:thioredoxin 1
MKRFFFVTIIGVSLLLQNCKAENPKSSIDSNSKGIAIIHLTNAEFKKMIFNYESNKEWKYEGQLPAIVDFYADWCAPCRQLSPIVEEIAKEYNGKIVVYKVDTVKEQILAQNLGITGLPTLLFIPAKGKPQVSMGLLPKADLVKAVNEILLIK